LYDASVTKSLTFVVNVISLVVETPPPPVVIPDLLPEAPPICVPDLAVNLEQSYFLYTIGDPILSIKLNSVSNNNCTYDLKLLKDSDGTDADLDIFSL
jgi:hypothetical protein